MQFDRQEILPGMIVHTRSDEIYGRLIQYGIGSWGNHDAILIKRGDMYLVGESVWPRARTVPLDEYAAYITRTGRQTRVYWPTHATGVEGMAASLWWEHNVDGTWYDVRGVVRLGYKAAWMKWFCRWPVFRRHYPVVKESEWAWWCTEGVSPAWTAARGYPVWQKVHPTPLTTEHRVADGTLQDLSEFVVRA